MWGLEGHIKSYSSKKALGPPITTIEPTCLCLSLIQPQLPIANDARTQGPPWLSCPLASPLASAFTLCLTHYPHLCQPAPVFSHPFAHIAPYVQKLLPTFFNLLTLTHSLRVSSGSCPNTLFVFPAFPAHEVFYIMLHQYVYFIYLFSSSKPRAEDESYFFIHPSISTNEQNAFPYRKPSIMITCNSIAFQAK